LESCLLKFEQRDKDEIQRDDTYRNAIKMLGMFGGNVAKGIRDDLLKNYEHKSMLED